MKHARIQSQERQNNKYRNLREAETEQKTERRQRMEIRKTSMDPKTYTNSNPYLKYNHIEVVSISPECSEVRMKVCQESLNVNGTVHGGLIFSMADCVAGITARADGRTYATQSAHINFIGNVTEGTITAKGILVKRGRKVVIIHVPVEDENGRLLADATVDMFCLDR